MKLHLKEDYESDMIAYNQAMDEYNANMQDYNDAMKDYNKAYKDWSANNPRQIYTQFSQDMRKTATTILLNKGIDKRDILIEFHAPSFSKKIKSPLWARCQVRVYDAKRQYGEDLVFEALAEVQQALADMCANSSIVVDSRWDKIKYWDDDPDFGIIYLSYSYQFVVPQNTLTKPVKPIKPSDITKPTMPKNPNADYEVVRRGYGEPDDDPEYLFYNLADNTITNIKQKLKQAGWISGGSIYIPKGTQFVLGPDKWVGGGDYLYESIKIVGGPLDGLLVPFLADDDELCRDTFIRKHCKRI